MGRALLDGSKTQTRRIFQPERMTWSSEGFYETHAFRKGELVVTGGGPFAPKDWLHYCPYGQLGDRLWVREHYRVCDGLDAKPPRDLCPAARLWYEADTPHQAGYGKFRPGMFMCRWMSRITLEITSVRVERLQDISRGDCMAEGCPFPNIAGKTDPVGWYRDLWEEINGPGSWALNPWVWCVEFSKVKP